MIWMPFSIAWRTQRREVFAARAAGMPCDRARRNADRSGWAVGACSISSNSRPSAPERDRSRRCAASRSGRAASCNRRRALRRRGARRPTRPTWDRRWWAGWGGGGKKNGKKKKKGRSDMLISIRRRHRVFPPPGSLEDRMVAPFTASGQDLKQHVHNYSPLHRLAAAASQAA